MQKIQKNKIQIYLSDEIKVKFDKFCEDNNLKSSAAGLRIIAQYFAEKHPESPPESSPVNDWESLRKEIESIKHHLSQRETNGQTSQEGKPQLEQIDESLTKIRRQLETQLENNFALVKRVNHIDSFLLEHFRGIYQSSHSLKKNVNHSDSHKIHSESPNPNNADSLTLTNSNQLFTDQQLKDRERLTQNKSTITRWRHGRGKIPEQITQNYQIVGSRWKYLG